MDIKTKTCMNIAPMFPHIYGKFELNQTIRVSKFWLKKSIDSNGDFDLWPSGPKNNPKRALSIRKHFMKLEFDRPKGTKVIARKPFWLKEKEEFLAEKERRICHQTCLGYIIRHISSQHLPRARIRLSTAWIKTQIQCSSEVRSHF